LFHEFRAGSPKKGGANANASAPETDAAGLESAGRIQLSAGSAEFGRIAQGIDRATFSARDFDQFIVRQLNQFKFGHVDFLRPDGSSGISVRIDTEAPFKLID